MAQTMLKKKLHKVIDDINDSELLETVYTILNSRIQATQYELNDEDLRIIEERRASYEAGKAKTYTLKEFKKKMRRNLSK